MAYHADGTTCSFAEEYEQDVLSLEKKIKKLKADREVLVNFVKEITSTQCSMDYILDEAYQALKSIGEQGGEG